MTADTPTPQDLPPAFAVAMASYPGQPLIRCSCGCLRPPTVPCPYAWKVTR